ncbi:AmmeMemoRadiSam system protein A [Shewanella woodyi]|uniref:AMMECR1 domain protein n=1 Tax=Shewanella woodyi (strain ATCC 51908 / MS32) TaxID=392500 RepID=B1KGM1_SHEWM|nr:AmmeMemoRadiSam system protein A [Shewanella woodyi]ACA85349.1 AMMECR1 domain protein [Shewanella woodyi ATCC 51908]
MPVSPSIELTFEEKSQLLRLSRDTLQQHFAPQTNPAASTDLVHELDLRASSILNKTLGCFVTLTLQGELRGCIGHIETPQRLHQTIPTLTLRSALHDPRFSPLTTELLELITIELSILSPLRSLTVNCREDLHHYLAQNRVGIVLTEDNKRGVFLPQVWQKMPTPKHFIDALLIKGHWPKNYWSEKIKIAQFSVCHFGGNSEL